MLLANLGARDLGAVPTFAAQCFAPRRRQPRADAGIEVRGVASFDGCLLAWKRNRERFAGDKDETCSFSALEMSRFALALWAGRAAVSELSAEPGSAALA